MIKLAIFASGSGSNAENIALHFKDSSEIEVSIIISNKKDAYVLERAQKLNITAYTYNKKEFDESDQIIALLKEKKIDFIILAGFLLKISPKLINAYPNRIINIHPALLPKFGGKGMYGDFVHKAVVEAKESESGITIHYVNENYDEGAIIFQSKCEITGQDTFSDVANKVHKLEYEHYPKIIAEILKKYSEKFGD